MRNVPGTKRIPFRHRAAFNLLFVLEHWTGPRRLAALKAGARLRAADSLRAQGPAATLPVPRVRSLSPEEFRRLHLGPGLPVVLEGAASAWPLAERWSFESFKRRYGSETIKLVQREGMTDDDAVFEREYSEELPFGEFLDQALAGGRKYMRFSPLLERFPELLDDLDHAFFDRMTGASWGRIYQAFIGGAGTATPLHNASSSFFFVNVSGVKRWTLVPNHYLPVLNPPSDGVGYNHSDARLDEPDLDRFPGLDSVDRLETVLGPGDVLFVPSWTWHCVRNHSATIGVRCGFPNLRNILGESLTLAFTRVFGARNPTFLESLYHMLVARDLPDRESRLLIPGLVRRG